MKVSDERRKELRERLAQSALEGINEEWEVGNLARRSELLALLDEVEGERPWPKDAAKCLLCPWCYEETRIVDCEHNPFKLAEELAVATQRLRQRGTEDHYTGKAEVERLREQVKALEGERDEARRVAEFNGRSYEQQRVELARLRVALEKIARMKTCSDSGRLFSQIAERALQPPQGEGERCAGNEVEDCGDAMPCHEHGPKKEGE